MAGFRLFGRTLTSENYDAGPEFLAADSKNFLDGDAERTTLPFHPLQAKALPLGDTSPSSTTGGCRVQELQLLPAGEVLGNTNDTESLSGFKEPMLRCGYAASLLEGSAGQPAATFLSISSSSAPASSLQVRQSHESTLPPDHKHEPGSSKGLVKIKVKAPQIRHSSVGDSQPDSQPLAKKPKVFIINRRLHAQKKEDIEKGEGYPSRHDVPRSHDLELRGQDQEPSSGATVAKAASGRRPIEFLPPVNKRSEREEDVNKGQPELCINIRTHKEKQGRDSPGGGGDVGADRGNEDSNDADKKEVLNGRNVDTPPAIVFKRSENRPRLLVLGRGLGMKWKEAPSRVTNPPTTAVTGKVRIVMSPKQPPLPQRGFEEELDLNRGLCVRSIPLSVEIGSQQFVQETQPRAGVLPPSDVAELYSDSR